MKGVRQRAPRNRSFIQFDGITKAVVTIAAKRIERVIFFENPLPDAEGTESMLAAAWKAVEMENAMDEERTSKFDSYVGCMDLIKIAVQNIFTNILASYWIRIGLHAKGRNVYRVPLNTNKDVNNDRGGVNSSEQHALQTYEMGMFKDREFFNYEKASVDFNRILDQWNLLITTIEQTLLKIIQLEIAKLCELHSKVVQWQRAEAYGVGPRELAQYAEELAADLKEPTILDDEDVEDVEDNEDDEDDEPEGELGDNNEDNHEVPTENDDGEQSGGSDGDEVQEELVLEDAGEDGEDEEDEL
ncbi:hypothetical protein L211DRAFT_853515 [Terfezia boudieri ATCC MYA-4762]|uniref:Uncharacterized protein n=1 Tax=Terfezia boudieri ATCC MYA-4762 TaxID=1051890 RepID=A0A3N4LCC4_9PEZI|nr:hypothetical protein L211DRAFT_853515 [Terfezia boudieri ATCC MYA-4762]